MKLAIGIILFSVVLEMVLLLRMVRLKKQEKTQYEKADRMLTECIAKNLDMEKMLAEMGQDYKKQQDILGHFLGLLSLDIRVTLRSMSRQQTPGKWNFPMM